MGTSLRAQVGRKNIEFIFKLKLKKKNWWSDVSHPAVKEQTKSLEWLYKARYVRIPHWDSVSTDHWALGNTATDAPAASAARLKPTAPFGIALCFLKRHPTSFNWAICICMCVCTQSINIIDWTNVNPRQGCHKRKTFIYWFLEDTKHKGSDAQTVQQHNYYSWYIFRGMSQ